VAIVKDLKYITEEKLMPNFDIHDKPISNNLEPQISYVLMHIYRNGNDYIGYHNDKEAINMPVISLTLAPNGVRRKFRFRKIGETAGWSKEFRLGYSDLLIMKSGCQKNL